MIEEHLPVLLIVLPLMAAPVCVLLHHARAAWLISLLVSAIIFFFSTQLMSAVSQQPNLTYNLGNWPAPWGIQLAVDHLNALLVLIITGISLLCSIFARDSIEKEIAKDRIYLFYTAYLLNLTGLLGVVLTGDAFNLFVFIEISSLSSYALISLGKDRQALYAAYKYLILGTVGATFILIGVGLLYVMTGTLNMSDMAVRLETVKETNTVFTAVCFIMIGACIKLALFPMHVWLPKAYTYAPSVISIFLAATTTKVFVYVLIRYLFTIFGMELTGLLELPNVIMILSLMGIIYGSCMAIRQTDVKSVFAYSSIAQIAYMILGVSFFTVEGVTASILHVFNHAIIKAALFMAIACVCYRLGSTRLTDMKGLVKNMPLTSLALFIAGLSLIGVPPSVGFISKWYLISAAINETRILSVVIILLGSFMSVIYMWKIIETIYFQNQKDSHEESSATVSEVPVMMLLPLYVLVFANIYLGLNTDFTLNAALDAAKQLVAYSL